jgi:hypothetical protein
MKGNELNSIQTKVCYKAPQRGQSSFARPSHEDLTSLEEDRKINKDSHHKLRKVLSSRTASNIILWFILSYTVLIFFRIAYDDAINDEERIIVVSLELVFLSLFLIEICLRIVAFGLRFLKNFWNIFDILIVLLCIILAAIEIEDPSLIDHSAFRLSALLRLVRLMVMFRKVNQVGKLQNKRKKKVGILEVTSVADKVVEILRSILETQLGDDESTAEELNWCIDMILRNRLNELNIEGGDEEQANEVTNWVGSQIAKNEEHYYEIIEDTKESTLGVLSIEIPRSSLDYLYSLDQLDFDIFELQSISQDNELKYLMYYILNAEGIFGMFNIAQEVFISFIEDVQSGYINTNTYHNSTHAADVAQMFYYFINTCNAKDVCHLSKADMFVCYLSAAIHDLGHPGFTNLYLINSRSELAITYNDRSVLENFHIASALKICQEDSKNIFKYFERDLAKKIREKIIKVVLATDASKHFKHLNKFKNQFGSGECKDSDDDRVRAMMMMMHAADISNPSRPWYLCSRWADYVLQEFFTQGDKERASDLPISPLCDRNLVSRPKSQVGFINFLSEPTFQALKMILPNVDANLIYISENKSQWEEILKAEEEGKHIEASTKQ